MMWFLGSAPDVIYCRPSPNRFPTKIPYIETPIWTPHPCMHLNMNDRFEISTSRYLCELIIQGLWLRQPQISFVQTEVLRSWWCRRASDWSIPFWSGLESARRWRTPGGHSNAQRCSAGLRDRPTPVSPFRERPPRCPRNNDVALCGWCQNGDPEVTEHEPSQFSYCCMGLVEEMGPADQSY